MSQEMKLRLLEFLEKYVEDTKDQPGAKLFDIRMSDGGKFRMNNCDIRGFSTLGNLDAGKNADIAITNNDISSENPYLRQIMELILILKQENLDKSKLDIFKTRFSQMFGSLPHAISIIKGLDSLS